MKYQLISLLFMILSPIVAMASSDEIPVEPEAKRRCLTAIGDSPIESTNLARINTLPPEILGMISAFLPGRDIIHLYQTGNWGLRQHLIRAPLYVDLSSHQAFSSSIVSSIGQYFPKLYSLEIGSEYSCYSGSSLTNEDISNLPPSLKSLDLANIKLIGFEGFHLLPRSLTGFSFHYNCQDGYWTREGLQNLPPSLHTLQANLPPAMIEFLPRTLTSLMLTATFGYSGEYLKLLPENLIKLKISCRQATNEDILTLPRNLEWLYLGSPLLRNLETEGVKNLPRNLRSFTGSGYLIKDKDISYLPRTLTKLILTHAHTSDEGILKLPPNLTHLELPDAEITSEGIRNLPRSLRFLSLEHSFLDTFSKLPPSLTSISVSANIIGKDLAELPNTLTYLNIEKAYLTDEDLQYLPPYLSYLSINQYGLTREGVKRYLSKSSIATLSLSAGMTLADTLKDEVEDKVLKEMANPPFNFEDWRALKDTFPNLKLFIPMMFDASSDSEDDSSSGSGDDPS